VAFDEKSRKNGKFIWTLQGQTHEMRLLRHMTATAMRLSTGDPKEAGGPKETSIDWAQALESNRRWLSTVVHARLADHQAAEDVLQEVALAAIKQSSKPTDPSKVAPWLYRIALRKVINHHRSSGRRRKLIDGAIASGRAAEKASGHAPGDWLIQVEAKQNFAIALNRLDPQDRQVLMLKYTEGWGYQELSEHLGITIKTVEYRLVKARRALRALLNVVE
jgi:RNA polymerase sigma factor (sigma-70 family)